jgi:hypothetical protein
MEWFFDAHVYVANWMSAIFMVRVPIDAISKKIVDAMAVPGILDFKATESHWVITWSLHESENYGRFGIDSGRGWMARLASVRDELLRGDIRSLYIGWLAAVSEEMMDDDEMEPLAMDGLGNLTAAQQALAEFLEVDEDLLAGAGIGSSVQQNEASTEKETNYWIDGLARDDVTALLKMLLAGKGQQAERSIKNRFAAWRRSMQGDKTDAPRRTVGELLELAEAAERIRHEQEKREQEKHEVKRRREREAYLTNLSKDFPKAWKSVQKTVERKSGRGYDEACRTLVDMSEAYALHTSRKDFQRNLEKFMKNHLRRKAFIQRLVKAGIWDDK